MSIRGLSVGETVGEVALVTGITGQDGSYLSEFLLEKGYTVHGIVSGQRPGQSIPDVTLHDSNLCDASNFSELLDEIRPTELYHLGAQSKVSLSFQLPVYTGDVTGLGTVRVLEAVRQFQNRHSQEVRFYQASSSEMFGKVVNSPQNEQTPFHPRSPYACAKAYAFWQTVNYREAYGMFACNGILFNHESPRRGSQFVTRKITVAAAKIKLGLQSELLLGNLDAHRDWGFAGDYVEAMWLMLQQDHPDDYVIATGETHSVRDFVEAVFDYHDLDWREYVRVDSKLFRPADVERVCGDASKARSELGWEPSVSFDELARMMAAHDFEMVQNSQFESDDIHNQSNSRTSTGD